MHDGFLGLGSRQVYKEHGYLWHFTLEEQMDYGPSIVAKFAHHERRVLEDLGQRVSAALPCVGVKLAFGQTVFFFGLLCFRSHGTCS